jgi:phospholipid-translocating ATPase
VQHANFFYKNIVWVFAMFWYQFFCNFDGGYLFDYSLVLLYNLAFTSLPVIVLGAFDQDINAKISMAYPELYRRGIKGLEYSRSVFWIYMFDGLYQSAVCFFVPFLLYSDNTSPTSNGYDMSGQVDFGTTVAAAAVLCVTLFVGLNTTMWTALMLGVLAVSALLLYVSWACTCEKHALITFASY